MRGRGKRKNKMYKIPEVRMVKENFKEKQDAIWELDYAS